MLPGEEFMVERWYNNALLSWHNSALNFRDSRSWLLPPHGDGSNWWFNPQVVSTILLSVIAILLGARFGSEAKSAPRRIARRIRKAGSRIKPLVLRPREVSHTAVLRGKRALRRFTQPREERAADDFVDARALLETRLDSMVGLATIKAHLQSLLDVLEMNERRRARLPQFDTAERGCMHMVFCGNPGTGKTAVATLIACVLREIGVLRKGHLVVAKKADLLGRYSNHVAQNTRHIVQQAIGGVLFIDEAYNLLQGEVELGREVINVIVDMCYTHKDDLVISTCGDY